MRNLKLALPRPRDGEVCGALYIVREGLSLRVWKGAEGMPSVDLVFRTADARERYVVGLKAQN